jgi:hypothetical protein
MAENRKWGLNEQNKKSRQQYTLSLKIENDL